MTAEGWVLVIGAVAAGLVKLLHAWHTLRRQREAMVGALNEHAAESPELVDRLKRTTLARGSQLGLGDGWIDEESERQTRRYNKKKTREEEP